jgi:hypothetical protein
MLYIVTGKPGEAGTLRELTLSEYLGIPEWKADREPVRVTGASEAKPSQIEKHGTGARLLSVATARGEGRRFPSADRGRGGGQLPPRLFLVGGHRS